MWRRALTVCLHRWYWFGTLILGDLYLWRSVVHDWELRHTVILVLSCIGMVIVVCLLDIVDILSESRVMFIYGRHHNSTNSHDRNDGYILRDIASDTPFSPKKGKCGKYIALNQSTLKLSCFDTETDAIKAQQTYVAPREGKV